MHRSRCLVLSPYPCFNTARSPRLLAVIALRPTKPVFTSSSPWAVSSYYSVSKLHEIMPSMKRKAPSSPLAASGPTPKKARPDFNDRTRYKDSADEEKYGIVLREYYPPEITNERAKKYATGELERPIQTLQKAILETKEAREKIAVGDCVVHWFKCDLRVRDNKGLSLAWQKAKSTNVPLVTMYLVSPQDWEAHLAAPIRVDFILRNLEVLKRNLAELDIPLYLETVEKRRNVPKRVMELCEKWGAKHVFGNTEYEVDELRRDAGLTSTCLEKGIAFNILPDTCVVEPGTLQSGKGGAFSVYSPWHRKWCAYLNQHPHVMDECPSPQQNPTTARTKYKELFEYEVPEAPESKRLTNEEKTRFRSMWPAGEDEAYERLDKFISQRIKNYSETRNLPGGNGTSVLSPHLSVGTLASRSLVRRAKEAAPNSKLTDDRKQGHSMWMGEVAWRDFYRHVLCNWPYICMNKPFKPEYSNIIWEYDLDQFHAWTEGKTGFPIVDAGMRQARHTGYMHNRVRMITASFLAKDLLIDWRMGEKWFMEHFIDGDFASNNGGWGFSASCGVDPQPYFRIFNPLLQSEKFDASGDYIRKWVPELADIKDKAIHDPYGRGAERIAKKNGYPRPIVEHKMARERCLSRYKEGIGRSTA